MVHPTKQARIGHIGVRADGNIKFSQCFDEMRLKRSLRPLRLLRLLRSLRCLRLLMPGKSLNKQSSSCHSQQNSINEPKLLKYIHIWYIQTPFCIIFLHPFSWRPGMLLSTKLKGHRSNFHNSGFPNHLQTKSSLNISICQNQIQKNKAYTQYGPIKNGRIKNQGSAFEKKKIKNQP